MKNMKMDNRTRYMFNRAYGWARTFSDDPRTQTGAVVLNPDSDNLHEAGDGANRMPFSGILDVKKLPERLSQEEKLKWLIHAELCAILDASLMGYPTNGMAMYAPWAACQDCAKAIIVAGISKVFVHKEMMDKTPDFWKDSIEIGNQMFRETNVELIVVSGKVGGVSNLFRGEIWEP